jgi:hypothetical protein
MDSLTLTSLLLLLLHICKHVEMVQSVTCCALRPLPCPLPHQTQADMVEDHFTNQPGPFPMANVTRHSFECVDARGEQPMLGTPGGDLAELMAAAMAVMKLR